MTPAAQTPAPTRNESAPSPQDVRRALAKHSYCILATASPDGVPHAVSVNYAYADDSVYIATGMGTKKARNAAQNPRVGICIPVRKYPFGPPFSVQFQGSATILPKDDPEIADLLRNGKLKKIVGYGVINEPYLCFIKVPLAQRVHTYGLGVPLRRLLKDVSHADRTVQMA